MTFDMPTNYSGNVVNSTGKFFIDYPKHIISNFGVGIILLIWMAVFSISSYLGSRKAILSASFITTIFSIYFAIREWINPIIPLVLIILTVVSAIGTKESMY